MAVEVGVGLAYVSFSQLTTWLKCGKAYQLGRIQKVQELPAVYLAAGTAVHSACDDVDSWRIEQGLL